MLEQLTIFDVEPVTAFDMKEANVRRLNSKFRYTDIIVKIPSKAKVIDELSRTTAPDERYELFEEYALGIWRYKRVEDKGFDWERVEELCKYARDIKELIPIRLHLSVEQSFIPGYVVRYV